MTSRRRNIAWLQARWRIAIRALFRAGLLAALVPMAAWGQPVVWDSLTHVYHTDTASMRVYTFVMGDTLAVVRRDSTVLYTRLSDGRFHGWETTLQGGRFAMPGYEAFPLVPALMAYWTQFKYLDSDTSNVHTLLSTPIENFDMLMRWRAVRDTTIIIP